MRKYKWEKRAVAVIMAAVMITAGMPVSVFAAKHGSTDVTITEDMVNNTPPQDYVINADMQAEAKEGLYDSYFLKDSIQTVSISIEENNLNYLLQNAGKEPYVMTQSVTIGQEQIGYAGLKTKGNWTLSATNNSDSDRFSFTIHFGKYITKKNYGAKQNFYGLGKVSFNNLYFDKTAMKEYCAMRLMDEMGVPTPQYGIAKLYINQEYYGVYFMVEAMDSSILEQYLNVSSKKIGDYLTKAIGTRFAYDNALDEYKDASGNFTMDSLSSVLYQNEDGDYVADGALKNSSGLWEKDDDTLQDVAEALPTVLTWEEKLTLLSEGKDFTGKPIDVNSSEYITLLNQIMDVDETLRYFATTSFVVQKDNMFDNEQNFGIYVDDNGKSMVLPWDYDLGWGCFYEPYDAEGIANLDLDNMYSKYFYDYKSKTPAQVYKDFPLFNVIYQNNQLLETYHNYMEDCAKIASLGGTTTDGKTYEAGRFASTIDTLSPQLIAAGAEELSSHVYYLNGIIQPDDMTKGLPNLKKLIALRSVGVWLQTNDMDTIVTGSGVNHDTIGNAFTGKYSVSGTLTVANADTGIFATATYPDEGACGPVLDVRTLDAESEIFIAIKEKLGCANDSDLIVYQMSDAKQPVSLYQLYIPVSTQFVADDVSLYTYHSDTVTKLVTTKEDNLYMAKTDDISYIAVAKSSHPAEGNVLMQSEEQANTRIEKVKGNTYIVGAEDMSTPWWSSFSEHYLLPENSTTTVEFENHSAEVDYWDNYVMAFTNESATLHLERSPSYKEYVVVRADDEGWGTKGSTLKYNHTYSSEEERLDILKDANVKMTITRNAAAVTVHEVVTSLSDASKSYERTVTFTAESKPIYLTMSVEGGYLLMKNVTVKEPEKTSDNTTGTKPSTNPGTVTKPKPTVTSTVKKITVPKVSKVTKLQAKAGKKKLTLTWKKVSGVKGYQIQVSTNKNFKKPTTIKIKKNTNKYVVSKLKAKKKYYVRIRAYKTYKDAKGKTVKVYGKYVKISKKTK